MTELCSDVPLVWLSDTRDDVYECEAPAAEDLAEVFTDDAVPDFVELVEDFVPPVVLTLTYLSGETLSAERLILLSPYIEFWSFCAQSG